MPTVSCGEDLALVHIVFWPGWLTIAYLIAKHNQFGLKDALLAAVGLKKFHRTLLINLVSFATLIGTLGFAVWIIQTCPS